MSLAVCLLFDPATDAALRRLWRRLDADGVASLASHTHGHHVPHLSFAVLRSWDLAPTVDALNQLPPASPTTLHFDALGTFRRSRSWLVPAVSADLAARQERVVAALLAIGADVHRHYLPGVWVPHCTLAPRTRLEQLPVLAAAVYEVLPLEATVTRAALVDSGTGAVHPLASPL